MVGLEVRSTVVQASMVVSVSFEDVGTSVVRWVVTKVNIVVVCGLSVVVCDFSVVSTVVPST